MSHTIKDMRPKKFEHRESYKHRYAKEIFKSWCDSKGETCEFEVDGHETLRWRPNRKQKALLEYPIVMEKYVDSVKMNWDENVQHYWTGFDTGIPFDVEDEWGNSFVPTYAQCTSRGHHVQAVIDIVLPHKGIPKYFIEVCHTNPVSDEKVNRLRDPIKEYGNLIEIDADWILNQTDQPSKLKIKRWLV